MLKKLLNPEVHDICPNCGKACTSTDILCPNCEKNLDELFEQLSDSELSTMHIPRWMRFLTKVKASRTWRIMNSVIVAVAFVSPWYELYSDIQPSEPLNIIGLKVLSVYVPSHLPDIFFFNCPACVSGGLIAFGYLSLVLYAVLNLLRASLPQISNYSGLEKALRVFVFTSGLLFLRAVIPMMMIAVAWGYWLVCVGLLSSLCLEGAELKSLSRAA